jgi:hypothetical protein
VSGRRADTATFLSVRRPQASARDIASEDTIYIVSVSGEHRFMTPAEMRAKAQECEDLARKFSKPDADKMYAELARQWRELADQLEKVRN